MDWSTKTAIRGHSRVLDASETSKKRRALCKQNLQTLKWILQDASSGELEWPFSAGPRCS